MDASTLRRITSTSRPTLAVWVAAFALGAYLGYGIAYSQTLTGLGSLGAIVAVLIVGALLATLAVIAVVARLMSGARGRSVARAALGAGLLLAAGVVAGWTATRVIGIGLQEQNLLEAGGTMNVSLDGLDGYAADADARALCRSEPGSDDVARVESDHVGTLGSAAVVVSLSMRPDWTDGRPGVSVSIQPADKSQGSAPVWQGPADALPQGGARGGSLVFVGVALVADEGALPPPAGLPAELSGTVRWSCDDWGLASR
jgi:hypothetical protein